MKKLLLFAFLWLLVGFSTGTSTLIGPVGWITRYGRARGWADGLENGLVIGIIAVYVIGSALVSLWLTRVVLRSPRGHIRIGVPAIALAAAAAALWLWMTPEVMGGGAAPQTRPGSSFTFGPYPTERRMVKLKREGYTAVISLLHPAVVPFEPKLLGEEKEAAERVGIEFIHVPMLPWVSDNTEALAHVEELARSGEGRYYVHCYLGQDRVRLLQRVVEGAEAHVSYELEARAQHGLEGKKSFERGEIVELVDGVFLTPYPTDDEMMKYILPGTIPRVVSLLDPGPDNDRDKIDEEQKILESHGIAFTLLPVSTDPYDPERVRETAETVARMPRPLIVHSFLSATSGRSASAESFLQAFRSNLPSLPPTFFKKPMEGGPVRVIAPNVAVGPRPSPEEFHDYLEDRGVRQIVFLGNAGSSAAQDDRAACEEADLPFRTATANPAELIALVATGGPWYLYGPGLGAVETQIAKNLGPAIPSEMTWNPVPDDVEETPAPTATELAPSEAEGGEPARGIVPFIRAVIPDAKKIIVLGPLFLLFTIAAAGLAGWLRTRREVRAPYTRKIFHFFIFTAAGSLHLLGGLSTVALFGGIVTCAVLYAVARGDGFPFYEAMARPTDAPRRTLFILVPLATTAIGGLAANLFFGAFAFVGYLVAGWGDAIGEPVGTAFGRHRYRVPSLAGVAATRSLEGSAAVCAVGILAAFLGLFASGLPLTTALGAAALCGVVGCAVEAISNHGLDNLTIQIAASGTAFLVLA